MKPKSSKFYKEKAATIRKKILTVSHRSKTPHIGSCLSLVELLTVLYFGGILKFQAKNGANFEKRDRLILSKGHGSLALYSALTEFGLLPSKFLDEYTKNGSLLPGHLNYKPIFGLEAATGSLGHGLPLAVGMALAAKYDKKPHRIFAILSDGECDEGSTWEAILAAAQWGLDNLIVVVDYNKIQSFGLVKDIMNLEPFVEKWRSFHWSVKEVDGHDSVELEKVLSNAPFCNGYPNVLIAHTIKGKGVSFMEDTIDWHYKNLTDDLLEQAIKEINASL